MNKTRFSSILLSTASPVTNSTFGKRVITVTRDAQAEQMLENQKGG
jgi:hypothetical protein